MNKLKKINKFTIVLVIVIIAIVLLVVYMLKKHFELRPLVFEWIKIILLILVDLYFVILCFKRKKNLRYFFIFLFILIFIFNKIKYVNTKESIVIRNNVKLIKVKNDLQCSFDYYKYVNSFFMSKNKLMSDKYIDWFFKSKYFNENQKYMYGVDYYSEKLKTYDNSEIKIISRKSYDVNNNLENRIVKVIMNRDELKEFNETIYNISDIKEIDFSNYYLILISYNEGEVIPFYLGKLDNDLNLVIKSKRKNFFNKLLVIKIEKNEFENIKVSDLDTYKNPF